MRSWPDPDLEAESARLGDLYRRKLEIAESTTAFWQDFDSRGIHTVDHFLEAVEVPSKDRAYREAMEALDEWRRFRIACGMP